MTFDRRIGDENAGITERYEGCEAPYDPPMSNSQSSIRLPPDRGDASTTEDTQEAQGASTEPLLVLVVDDNADARAMYCEALAQMGYSTCAACDGQRGVDNALRFQPDAILMDVSMPILDGIEATRRIKADPRTRDCIVVLVTAHGAAVLEEARAAGGDACLAKPFNPFALERIFRALATAKSPSEPPPPPEPLLPH